MVVNINEYVVSESFLSVHGDNIEEYYKQDIVSKIEFEAIITSIKMNFFHQHMMNIVNKLELSYQEYKNNGNLRYENYKGKFLFPKKYFISFVTDHQ